MSEEPVVGYLILLLARLAFLVYLEQSIIKLKKRVTALEV